LIDKPGDYALGSLESRTAARTVLERTRADKERTVIVVRIELIGHDGKEPLPVPRRILGNGGTTEIINVAGRSL
jgi:hypothetical protein